MKIPDAVRVVCADDDADIRSWRFYSKVTFVCLIFPLWCIFMCPFKDPSVENTLIALFDFPPLRFYYEAEQQIRSCMVCWWHSWRYKVTFWNLWDKKWQDIMLCGVPLEIELNSWKASISEAGTILGTIIGYFWEDTHSQEMFFYPEIFCQLCTSCQSRYGEWVQDQIHCP